MMHQGSSVVEVSVSGGTRTRISSQRGCTGIPGVCTDIFPVEKTRCSLQGWGGGSLGAHFMGHIGKVVTHKWKHVCRKVERKE